MINIFKIMSKLNSADKRSNSKTAPFDVNASDGCTLWFDSVWRDFCVEHDRSYWHGGTKKQRFLADIKLLNGVSGTGHPYVAILMFIFVRAFGSPLWPLRTRWGKCGKYHKSLKYSE